MTQVFTQLALIVGLAVIVSIAMKALKQPLIIGYIITGIIAGPSFLGFISDKDSLQFFASLGVALLLFIVGLGLDTKMIRGVGPIATITGIAQIIFTSVLGFGLSVALGFSYVTAFYLGVAFAFSSTIVILQLLADKKDQDKLYGRISIGFLLVQDIAAMIIFLFLSSSDAFATDFFGAMSLIVLKLTLIIALIYFLIKYVIPRVDKILAENRQVLFIFSLATCFIMASVFETLGFSLELGALAAGVLLSTSPYHREIATRIYPLRDFFLIIFFIFLGTGISPDAITGNMIPILLFSLFILIGNPFIVVLIMTKLGHTRRTSFFAGLTVAQISEFSLIMLGIGITLGHIDDTVLAIATTVGLITIAISSYLISYNAQVYKFLAPYLKMLTPFAKDRDRTEDISPDAYTVLLFGAHRMGGGILATLNKKKISTLVVDHDPHLVTHLQAEGVSVQFGSADDAAFIDELNLSETKLIISTVPDLEINSFLIDYFKRRKIKAVIVCVASYPEQAKQLYAEGASYVVMPPYLGRRFMVDLFNENLFNASKYKRERNKHKKDLAYLTHPH